MSALVSPPQSPAAPLTRQGSAASPQPIFNSPKRPPMRPAVETRVLQTALGAFSLASEVFGLDVIELWTEGEEEGSGGEASPTSSGALRCAFAHVTDAWRRRYDASCNKESDIAIKSELCQSARRSKGGVAWQVLAENSACDPNASGNMSHVQQDLLVCNPFQCKTQFSVCIDGDFLGISVFVVGFSRESIAFSSSKVKFINGLGHAIYISAFENDDDESIQGNSSSLADPEMDKKGHSSLHSSPLELPTMSSTESKQSNEEKVINSEEAASETILQTHSISNFLFPVASIPPRSSLFDIDVAELKDLKSLADGSNSNIFTAKFNGETVIVKFIKEALVNDPVARSEFEAELNVLSRIDHPNIARLIGSGSKPRRFLVVEFLDKGTLQQLLSKNVQSPGFINKMFHKPTFSFVNLLLRAKDLALALEYLHEQSHDDATVIHRDLKPDNIGFAADGTIKLLDFGLCVCIKKHIIDSPDEIYDMSGGTGSLRYMAPEVALHNNYNEKVDIYSFGIILWQMARDRIPFQAFSVESFMRAVVHGNCRPKLDKAWPPRFCQLLEMCWHKDYSKRPTASQLVIELTLLIDEAQMDALKKRNNFLEMSFGSQ